MSEKLLKDVTIPEDADAAVIHEILEIVARQKLTVYGARTLLQKATRVVELAAFEWAPERRIPFTI